MRRLIVVCLKEQDGKDGHDTVGAEKRKPYLKDIVRNEDGELIYTGDFYRMHPDTERKRSIGRCYLELAGLALIPGLLSIISGCIGGAGSTRAFYVILPYIGEICALFAMYWSLAAVLAEKNRIRAFILERNIPRISGAVRILGVFAAAGLAASILFLVRHGFTEAADPAGAAGTAPYADLVYPVLKALTAAAAAMFGRYFRNVKWDNVARSPEANS